jgi:hypothetical protein
MSIRNLPLRFSPIPPAAIPTSPLCIRTVQSLPGRAGSNLLFL